MIYGNNTSFKDEEIYELKNEVIELSEMNDEKEEELKECEKDFEILNELRINVIEEIKRYNKKTREIPDDIASILLEMLEDVPY